MRSSLTILLLQRLMPTRPVSESMLVTIHVSDTEELSGRVGDAYDALSPASDERRGGRGTSAVDVVGRVGRVGRLPGRRGMPA